MTLYYDSETYSEVPIKNGTYVYAANAEVTIVTYAFDDGPVQCWDVTEGGKMPGDLEFALLDSDDEVVAHNAMFDRNVLRLGQLKLEIPIPRWRCTMVGALAHSLPGGLGKLCEIFKIPEDQAKQKEGRKLMMLFCKPLPKNSKLRRATRLTHPEEWRKFLDYAGHDISAMRAIDKKLPTWNSRGAELALWHRDQRINDRGFCVDTKLAENAILAVGRSQTSLAARTKEITKGDVESTTQRDQLLAHILSEHGVMLPDMQKATLERRVSDLDLPPELRELLAIRLEASASSTSKYKALISAVSDDGRLRGTKQFDGAGRTGRWAGRTFQPDNLPRPNVAAIATHFGLETKISKYLQLKSAPGLTDDMIEEYLTFGIDAMLGDCADLFYGNVMALASTALRGTIIAPKGKKLVVGDLANIEGRKASWLAGEDWKLAAFRAFDADRKNKAKDLYNIAYAKSFGIDPATVDKPSRQIGKVQELMLQYQGGVGAFATGALTYGIDLEEMAENAYDTLPFEARSDAQGFYKWVIKEKRSTFGMSERAFVTCDTFKRLWRAAHPAIESYWPELEDAIRAAISRPGNTITSRRLRIHCSGAWLRIVLPSGRALCYPSPRVSDNGRISYMGVNIYTKQWTRIYSYGGKFLENITQAGSRDVLVAPWEQVENAGYELVLHVHDENVTETPDSDDYSIGTLCKLMVAVPACYEGLPLAAAGFETYRYRK